MPTRIVWSKGLSGSNAVRRMAPQQRHGGTCEFGGQVLIYDDLPGEIKVEGGIVFWQGQEFCPADKVAAILNKEGKQICP